MGAPGEPAAVPGRAADDSGAADGQHHPADYGGVVGRHGFVHRAAGGGDQDGGLAAPPELRRGDFTSTERYILGWVGIVRRECVWTGKWKMYL